MRSRPDFALAQAGGPEPARPAADNPLALAAPTPAAAAPTAATAPTAAAPGAAGAPALPAPDRPGIIGRFGNWVQQGVSNMGAGFGAVVTAIGGQANEAAKGAAGTASTVAKGAADAAKGAADVARETAVSVAKLPATGVVAGREPCVLAPNGAPDCRVAAETMCRAKGYGSGTSVNFQTSEKCPPRRRSGMREGAEDACTLEHFVTRALCQ